MNLSEVARRFQELFGLPDSSPVPLPTVSGGVHRHCEICPKPDGEACHLACAGQREALADGIKVY